MVGNEDPVQMIDFMLQHNSLKTFHFPPCPLSVKVHTFHHNVASARYIRSQARNTLAAFPDRDDLTMLMDNSRIYKHIVSSQVIRVVTKWIYYYHRLRATDLRGRQAHTGCRVQSIAEILRKLLYGVINIRYRLRFAS